MERQALLHADGKLRFHDSLNPSPSAQDLKSDEVLIKVAYVGLCGSDLKEFKGHHNFAPDPEEKFYTDTPAGQYCVRYPFAMGHEYSGEIVALGKDVGKTHPMLKVGVKAAVNPTFGCKLQGRTSDKYCASCQLEMPNICKNLCLRGLNADGGGLSTHAVVTAWAVIPVPEAVPLSIAALVQPLAISWHAVRISGFADLLPEKKTAIVFGAGPIGLACILALIGMGARRIVVSEYAEIRRKQAISIMEAASQKDPHFSGVAVSPADVPDGTKSSEFLKEKITPETKIGASRSFDCAGVPPTFNDAISSLSPSGQAVNIAVWHHHGPKSTVPIAPMKLTVTEKAFRGSMGLNNQDMEEVVDAIYFEKMPVSQLNDMITSIYPLEKSSDAMSSLLTGKDNQVKVLIAVDGDLPQSL